MPHKFNEGDIVIIHKTKIAKIQKIQGDFFWDTTEDPKVDTPWEFDELVRLAVYDKLNDYQKKMFDALNE